MLGLWARPHVDSGLSPQQLTFGTEILLPVDFLSKEAEELDGAEFYKKLQRQKIVTMCYLRTVAGTCPQVVNKLEPELMEKVARLPWPRLDRSWRLTSSFVSGG